MSARTAARWIDYTRIACASPAEADAEFFDADARRRFRSRGGRVEVMRRHGEQRRGRLRRLLRKRRAHRGLARRERAGHAQRRGGAISVRGRRADGDFDIVAARGPTGGARSTRLAPRAGPVRGGTTVTVRGDGFLPGDNLRCRFEDDVTGLPPFVADATWVDDRSVTCSTPPRSPRETTRRATAPFVYPGDGTDPRASLEVGYDANTMNGTIAPCFVANVTVSNDGVAFSDDAPGAKFLYCDVYAAAAPSVADPTYPYVTDPSTLAGTPNAPFTDLQSALHAALRGARADVADGRSDGGVTVRRSQGPVPRSARWLDKDVVRLAPGVYRGEGNVLLALDAQLVDFVAGDVDDWPDVERGGNGRVGPTASVDCREVSLGRGNKLARGIASTVRVAARSGWGNAHRQARRHRRDRGRRRGGVSGRVTGGVLRRRGGWGVVCGWGRVVSGD